MSYDHLYHDGLYFWRRLYFWRPLFTFFFHMHSRGCKYYHTVHAAETWNASWTWTVRVNMNMQHHHGHVALIWTCSRDKYMQH